MPKLKTLKMWRSPEDLLSDLDKLDRNISRINMILQGVTISNVSINFFARSGAGVRMFHALNQDHFEFNLELEVTKLLNDNLDQLIQHREEVIKKIHL